MSEENVNLVRLSVELWNRGKVEELVETFSEDAEFEPAPGFVEAENVKGRDEIRRFFDRLHDSWRPGDTVALGELREIGDSVMFSFRWRAIGDVSGIETSSEWIAVDTFRDGRCVRMQIFSDVDDARAAAGST
jgi:ketosteroid isomerase-like protein